jgi:hypothetical protein
MRRLNHAPAGRLLISGLLFFAASMPAWAQDEPVAPAQPSAQEEQLAQKPATQPDDVPSQAESAPNFSFEKPVINIATGAALSSTRSPFRWGHLSVLSVEALQVYDSNYLFRKQNVLSELAGAVRGLVVYSIRTGRSNFSVQYRPQFWTTGEGSQFDYASHMVDFHTFRYMTAKWGINISDQFGLVPDQGRLQQIGFTADYGSSTSTHNPFLATGRRLLTNSFGLSVDHSFTARNRMEFLVRQQYIRLSQPLNGMPGAQNFAVSTELDTGAEIGWTHTWRRDNEFGVKYAYDYEDFRDTQSSAQLHSVLFGFSRRLRPSLLLRVSAGPALRLPARSGAVSSLQARETYQASAALFKTFGRSGLTLSYSRSNDFTGQITDQLNDRYDASYSQHWTRRIDTVIGGAYVRQAVTASHLQGKSTWAEVNYRLNRSWSFYSTYSYLTQVGGTIPYGPRQVIASGIRWSWDMEAGR